MVSDGGLVKYMQQTPGKIHFDGHIKMALCVVYDTNNILSRINKTLALQTTAL